MIGTPKTIQIFLPLGDPQAIRVAEITTRIVRVIEVPRSLLLEFQQMPESNQVGIYFLVGEDEKTGEPKLYIGQSGNIGKRLGERHIGQITRDRAHLDPVLRPQVRREHVEQRLPPGEEHKVQSTGGERLGERGTEPFGRTGDDGPATEAFWKRRET